MAELMGFSLDMSVFLAYRKDGPIEKPRITPPESPPAVWIDGFVSSMISWMNGKDS
jgi:hypothetical protein